MEKLGAWRQLGLIAALYLVLSISYAIFLNSTANVQELAKQLPGVLSQDEIEGRIDMITIILFVVLSSFPLFLSSFLVGLWGGDSEGSFFAIILAILVPFHIYLAFFDKSYWVRFVHEHGVNNSPGSWISIILLPLGYYFTKYKVPLFVTSIMLGGWLGLKVRSP